MKKRLLIKANKELSTQNILLAQENWLLRNDNEKKSKKIAEADRLMNLLDGLKIKNTSERREENNGFNNEK